MLKFYFFFFNVKGLTLRTITSINTSQLPISKQCLKGKGAPLVLGLRPPGLSGYVALPQGCRKPATSLSASSAGLASQAHTFTLHSQGCICSSAGRWHHLFCPNLNIQGASWAYEVENKDNRIFPNTKSCKKASAIHT